MNQYKKGVAKRYVAILAAGIVILGKKRKICFRGISRRRGLSICSAPWKRLILMRKM